ncbi:MAG: hypothetical protein RIS91_986, partial [Bacteroidota bacterium]
ISWEYEPINDYFDAEYPFFVALEKRQKQIHNETDTNNTPSSRSKLIHFHQSVSKWKNTFVASRNRNTQNIQVAKRSKIST